ncbi:unnamed protein product [Effrenium voratum]|nr:unnamed protein product [Effrenium voratum]
MENGVEKKDKKEKKEKKQKEDKEHKKDKKEKKDKSEKKEKKERKEKDHEEEALAAFDDLFQPLSEEEAEPPPPLPTERRHGKDKKEKKERKQKRATDDVIQEEAKDPLDELFDPASPKDLPVEEAVVGKTKKDKKEKKEKKEKKDKRDKKEKKEKKRKAKEPEPLKNDPMDAGVGEIVPEEVLPEGLPDEFDIFNEFGLENDDRASPAAKRDPSPSPAGSVMRKRRKKEPIAEEQVDLSTQWTRVMEAIKPRRGLVIKDEEAHAYVENFIARMEATAAHDLEEYHAGRPMIKKLELLPEAVEVMEKYQFTDAFITYGGCKVLALWLQSLPNGALPSVHLRSALLRCMERLPITKEALKSAGEPLLGKIVAGLQTHPEETVGNRKRAQNLVQRWLRQIMEPDNSHSLEAFLAQPEKVGAIPRPPPETEESLQKLEEESAKRLHPAIPVIQAKDYVIQPVSTAQPIIREKLTTDTYKGKLNEVLKVMARPNKRSWKPHSVSVAGRQLNAE